MGKYQYKSITVQHTKNSVHRYSNVSNLTEKDEDGFVEFDSCDEMSKYLKNANDTTVHVKTNRPIIEFVELV